MSPHGSNMTQRMKEILVLLQVKHRLVTIEKNSLKKLNDCLGNEDFIANVCPSNNRKK